MDCQCNIDNESAESGYVIRHVQGNYIEIRIPFTMVSARTLNGSYTSSEYSFPIRDASIIFQKGPIKKEIPATIIKNSSTIIVVDRGTLPIGTYDIIVSFTGMDNKNYRYKQKTVLQIVDSTDGGGQYETNEFDVYANYTVVRGKYSIITITDDVVSMNEGSGFDGEITDSAVKLYSRFGNSSINIDDDSVNIVIN